MDVYVRCFTHDEFENFKGLPVIASIDNVTNNEYKTLEFELAEDKAVRVYAVGEGPSGIMADYGGIENAETGELVWEMYHIITEHAGGASKNRKADCVVPLAAGRYRLHYRSDDTHSFDDWNNLPPDHYWWGIRLFDVSDTVDQSRARFWNRAVPEELGWSSEKLEALRSDCQRLNTAALVIATDGKLVFEWGRTANNIYSHSTRKSLLSALYGIYASEGKIDTSMTLEQLGIRERVSLSDIEKQAKVIDLLKARSGVYIPAAAEVKSMRDARPRRGRHEPGTHWYYNNWDFNVLGTIFRDQTGEDIYEAFDRRIAEPIGMQDYSVEQQNYGYEENFSIHPEYPFLISARDMARVGQLFLQQGQWQGRQVVPANWVQESTQSYSDTGIAWRGYGYMWWTIEDEHCGMQKGDYFASGYGGQKLFVLPRINTVVVHRVNIYLPGVDVGKTGNAPFQLMPKIIEAYTGERKQRVPAIARKIVPGRHLLQDYVAIHAATLAGPRQASNQVLRYTAYAWLVIVTCSLPGLVLLMARGPCLSRLSRVIWALAVLLLGPLGLIAYHFACRQPKRSPDSRGAMTTWGNALYSGVHSVVGYFIAVAFAIVYFVFVDPNASTPTIMATSYVAPFVAGLMVFRIPFLVSHLEGKYWLALRRTLLTEAASLNFVLAAVFPTFFFFRFRWFPGDLELASPLFWLLMSISGVVSVLVVWPFNAWMLRRGFGSVLVSCATGQEKDDETETKVPLLKNTWHVLLLSLVLLVASVYVTISEIPS
jgi:CubicO group peptidase (beta-lactamase class C family)